MKKRRRKKSSTKKRTIQYAIKGFITLCVVFISNYYLQLCQNDFSWSLATKFAFQWHTEKFLLGCLVLLVFMLFIMSIIGSWPIGLLFYLVFLGVLGFADYQKMLYRTEPIYPDDLKMITELGLMKEMIGTGYFLICLLVIGVTLGIVFYTLYRSTFLPKKIQIIRVTMLVVSFVGLSYISHFNNPNNLLRKAYNKSALWIPYSQKMNYYNTGFVGGFLYNLKVEPMEKPNDYSKEAVEKVVEKYQKKAKKRNKKIPENKEEPNIIYIMSESFSDPLRLKGVKTTANPLKYYREIANETYSGQMLSQNYGGGTANIEFEALTSFSMELFNSQLTTPYTMLLPKMTSIPSIVSNLKDQGYSATAIHPYNTSMYKRKDVYQMMGFDAFIDEKTMKHQQKIEKNPYISDASAFKEVLDLLQENDQPQFIHLVTMQTHMPYQGKYDVSADRVTGDDSPAVLSNYMADIEYTSEALFELCKELEKKPRRTLIVFWGDHLPGIYSDEFKAKNADVDMHLTEFLFYDSQGEIENDELDSLTSPFYFTPSLYDKAQLKQPGFYQLLLAVKDVLPAFEQNYYFKDGVWHDKKELTKEEEKLYKDYRLIQYDVVAGKKYSVKKDFFKE